MNNVLFNVKNKTKTRHNKTRFDLDLEGVGWPTWLPRKLAYDAYGYGVNLYVYILVYYIVLRCFATVVFVFVFSLYFFYVQSLTVLCFRGFVSFQGNAF